MVLGRNRAELRELILAGGRDVLEFAGDQTNIRFEFSPEVFNLTEPEYVLGLCNDMTALWEATAERPVILNLPATVEVATLTYTPIRSSTCTAIWSGVTA